MTLQTDICVIGAGSGGLSTAVGAIQLGVRVILVEEHKMGGDCLNTGCVPSKALLSAAAYAHSFRETDSFGIQALEPSIQFERIHSYVQSVIAAIAPHDSVKRMESLGIQVLRGQARFINPSQVSVGNVCVQAKRFVIATGSSPQIPSIPGIETIPYFTNETLFTNTQKPDHLLILGGGPIGVEMAQAHKRLGCKVSLFQRTEILPRDDRDAVQIVRQSLRKEGIDLYENSRVQNLTLSNGIITLTYEKESNQASVSGSHLLVATGRRPNLKGLGLDTAGIETTDRGIKVTSRLQTTNKRVYALGDVTGSALFTHWASYQAGILIKNILFNIPAKMNLNCLPWATYTDPELAQVGLLQDHAEQEAIPHQILKMNLQENDRAQAEGDTQGFIKAIVTPKGKILGATIVGSKAGDLLTPWAMAVSQGLSVKALATTVLPYPTRSELSKMVAGSFYKPKLFSPTTQKIVRFLMRLKCL